MSVYQLAQDFNGEMISFFSNMANRHGLITGATGTGKTVTLRKLAEVFSDDNIPLFLVDVKGDLSGISKAGSSSGKIAERLKLLNIQENDFFKEYPVTFWDILGNTGIPLRTTFSEMGPMLLTRLLNLNDVQSGVLSLVFKVADDLKLPIIDLKDLRSMLKFVSDNASEYKLKYGNISTASIGAILRQLLVLEEQGSELLFGEPALDIQDFIRSYNNQGMINILNAREIINSPAMFSAFLLWLLSELFEQLPEVGDVEKPKFAILFDEAHLLFDNTSPALIEKITQVIRLIRSKGVSVIFATQNPLDIPDVVLAQLGNVFQHALRAFTPKEQKNIKAVADMFRINEKLNVKEEITNLGVGEALVSFLDAKGSPQPVRKVYIIPPKSQLAPISELEQQTICQKNPLFAPYKQYIDNVSAFELLAEQLKEDNKKENVEQVDSLNKWGNIIFGKSTIKEKRSRSITENMVDSVSKTVGRKLVNKFANQIIRGILGSIIGRR